MSDDLLPGPLDAVVGGLIASAVTWAVVRARAAQAEALAHSERVFELNEDLRRWIRDRDRRLDVELKTITGRAASGQVGDDRPPEGAGSQLYSGAHVRKLAAAKERALHEYRDEATAKIREFSALMRAESRLHRRRRRRLGLPLPALGLPRDCRESLGAWRADAVNPADSSSTAPVEDVSRAELEPGIAAMEATDPPEFTPPRLPRVRIVRLPPR